MPKKGHRAASRQAQIRQKRRRGKSVPQVVDSAPVQSASAISVEADPVEAPPQEARTSVSTSPSPQPARRSGRRRASAEPQPALVYNYLGSELKQIGVITTVIVAILAVLTVLLG